MTRQSQMSSFDYSNNSGSLTKLPNGESFDVGNIIVIQMI